MTPTTTDQATRASAFGNVYQFTGRRFDNPTGLYQYRNRYYEPRSGRFLSRDPKGYVDGMNVYAYAVSNPVNYKDPRGTNVYLGGGYVGKILKGLRELCPCFDLQAKKKDRDASRGASRGYYKLTMTPPSTKRKRIKKPGTDTYYKNACECYCDHVVGCNLIDDLINKSFEVYIREPDPRMDNPDKSGNFHRRYGGEGGYSVIGWNATFTNPADFSSIHSNQPNTRNNSPHRPPSIGLGHELVHARQRHHREQDRTLKESEAVRGENQLRREMGTWPVSSGTGNPLTYPRTTHNGLGVGRLVNPTAPLLDAEKRYCK